MDDDPVAILRRWADAGGRWAVIARRPGSVTVGLYRCDGGEEVDRFTSDDPAVVRLLADKDGSGDDPGL